MQGELETALAQLSGGSRVRVEGAGRTDAGVHAREQVIAFTYRGRLGRRELHEALTALLPADIGLGPLRNVDAGFQPRHRARYREYRYSIWNGPRSPLRERFAYGVRQPLDVAAMQRAAEEFLGRHDFSTFGGFHRQPVRTLHRVAVGRRGKMVTVELVGDAFLRGMVRRIVAALVRVGLGRTDVEEVRRQLRSSRPAFEGDAAPAHGLTLWKVPMGVPHERRWTDQELDAGNGTREKDE